MENGKIEVTEPFHIVTRYDGEPFEGECTCPVCALADREGIPMFTLDEDGELRRVPRGKPRPTIEVRVEPTLSTAPYIGTAPLVESIPQGCNAWDFVQYLLFTQAELRGAFGPFDLVLSRERRVLDGNDELHDDDVVVLADRSTW